MKNTDELLRRLDRITKQIYNDVCQIQNLKSIAMKTNHPIQDERVQGTPALEPMNDCVISWIDLEQEVERLQDEQKTIWEIIKKIKNTDSYDVIWKKYVQNMSISQISKANHMSRQKVYYLIDDGKSEINTFLDKKEHR